MKLLKTLKAWSGKDRVQEVSAKESHATRWSFREKKIVESFYTHPQSSSLSHGKFYLSQSEKQF